jgi:hypothetical protein
MLALQMRMPLLAGMRFNLISGQDARHTRRNQAKTPHRTHQLEEEEAGGLLEIQSQARHCLQIVVPSRRRPRGRRREMHALQARELSAEIKETRSVIYAKGETMI